MRNKNNHFAAAILIFFSLAFSNIIVNGQGQTTTDSTKNKPSAKEVFQKISENVKLGGWIDAQYQYEKNDDAEKNFFQIRRARLDVKGSLSKWVDFRLQADFAPNPRLIDAFVKVNFCKYVKLQVGQFKIPFSLENILSPLDL